MSLRLENHRKMFWAGDHTGRAGFGNRLRLEDLTRLETQELFLKFSADPRCSDAKTNEGMLRVYCAVLNEHGIMCFHPVAYRRYGERGETFSQEIPFSVQRWFHCPMCGADCINRR